MATAEQRARWNKTYYEKGGKEKVRANARLQRERIRAAIKEAKDRPCTDCGISYPYYVMDFDHVRGEKRMEVGRLAGKNSSLRVLLEEIDKCEVVCSNCHRIRTHMRL